MRISTRLTLVNAAILICILLLTSLLTIPGIYFALYHQAEVELENSVARSLASAKASADLPPEKLPAPPSPEQREERLARDPDWVPPPPFVMQLYRDAALTPGVVLRVTDDTGRKIFDSASHYPSLADVRSHIVADPPFWANKDMQVATLGNFHLYYETVAVDWQGRRYDLHFLRMITAERSFLRALTSTLLLTNALGVLIALLAGYFVSRRTLKPIRTITQAAREIEVSDLSRRIPEPPAKDELRELVVTFNHMLARLESGFAQQRQFVSDASHELRTPVTVMLGYSDMLSRWGREDAETLDEGIAAIRSEAQNMKDLIERLLFLARADMNRQALNRTPVDMAELVGDVAKKAELVAADHTLTLTANDTGTIAGDPVLIRQMLRIFLDNAIKYTPQGGHIALASRREGDRLHVTVADDGIGIAPEHQERIFERFFRVDSARTKESGNKAGGTGLGLAIARWIADAHGIELSLDSAPGRGTTIHLLIPLAEDAATDNGSPPLP
ncbi:MAG: HAMP domain-containing protein [Schwartzia sp.]|nr:HAMP domain-containing protein [Schwartzia sp. (in: firmicutes)]